MKIDHTCTITLGGRKALRQYSIDRISDTVWAFNLDTSRGTRFVGTPQEIAIIALAFQAIGYTVVPS